MCFAEPALQPQHTCHDAPALLPAPLLPLTLLTHHKYIHSLALISLSGLFEEPQTGSFFVLEMN